MNLNINNVQLSLSLMLKFSHLWSVEASSSWRLPSVEAFSHCFESLIELIVLKSKTEGFCPKIESKARYYSHCFYSVSSWKV
jgi:hypothetical protein